MRSSSDSGPKIVQIETWYVETEAINFRDVVQSLTGMNSSIAAHSPQLTSAAAKPPQHEVSSITNSNALIITSPMPLNTSSNVSFKDFDPFFADLPSIEDLLC